jgi:hypothetical protein
MGGCQQHLHMIGQPEVVGVEEGDPVAVRFL